MNRTPEPEVMDDPAQALAYAEADFEEVNANFVRSTLEFWTTQDGERHILDLGCGPGDIPIRLAEALPEARVTGIDASEPMVALGWDRLRTSALGERVTLEVARLPLTDPGRNWDLIISNSLLHHLPEGAILWNEVRRQCAGSGRRTHVRIMDLRRPPSPEEAQSLVDTYSGEEPEILRRDFYNSLLAAFTPEEVREQLEHAGLEALEVSLPSDRHLLITGIVQG